jgi:hypothetical protein
MEFLSLGFILRETNGGAPQRENENGNENENECAAFALKRNLLE